MILSIFGDDLSTIMDCLIACYTIFFQLEQFSADIGNVSGLYTGMSVITIFELIMVLIEIILTLTCGDALDNLCNVCQRPASPTTISEETTNSTGTSDSFPRPCWTPEGECSNPPVVLRKRKRRKPKIDRRALWIEQPRWRF